MLSTSTPLIDRKDEPLQPAIAIVQEPLDLYGSFIRNNNLIKRAQTPYFVEAYLRWLYVRRGGVQAYTHLDFSPTGWEGYVVGLPFERQQATLQNVGEAMLLGMSQIGKQAGVPPDRLLAQIAEGKFTQRTAQLLEPVFFTALMDMRQIGSEGFDMHAYSAWRAAYEQTQFRLEQALQSEQTLEGKRKLLDQIVTNQWALAQKIAEITRGRTSAAVLYEEVHNATVSRVTTVLQTVEAPLLVDAHTGRMRYVLPAAPGINTAVEEIGLAHAPEWYIALRNIPLIGHPLIRAAID